jgi:hypothetical protein
MTGIYQSFIIDEELWQLSHSINKLLSFMPEDDIGHHPTNTLGYLFNVF